MSPKDFKGAMNRQRSTQPPGGTSGVVGDRPNPYREELEQVAERFPSQEIELERLHDNPFQHLARPVIDEEALEELSASIKENGFYGTLLARPQRGTSGEYELAYGHRRREAARRAGLTSVPVKLLELDDVKMARIMASENFSREDLTPLGEANIVGYLYTSQNMSAEEVAAAVGKKRGWVQNRLALYQAPQDVKQMVEQKPEAFSHARLLIHVSDPVERTALIAQTLQNDLTFEQLRTYLEKPRTAAAPTTSSSNSNKERAYASLATSIEKSDRLNLEPNPPKATETTQNCITDANSEKSNNLLQETHQLESHTRSEELITPERLYRAEALKRLDRASVRFEKLTAAGKLAQDERDYLREIANRLNNILEQTDK
jgi:ParB/RepB/Spo0J family partition protein